MADDPKRDGRPPPARVDPALWARASPLLDELLDLDAQARAARLAELRANEPALAAHLAALLAAQTQIDRGAFLEGAAVPAPVPTTLAGRAIGAYTLERELGVGGMGTVWLGRRHDGRFDGAVAIKLPNLALLNRGGAERFAREGSVLGRLSHPHIARLLDAGVADNQPYLVLEYVDGLPIDRWCDQQALGVHARLRLVLDVLSAVEHAHANLVLHRDLKPSNILVDRAGRVKLLDFGVAKLLADVTGAAASTELTLEAGRAFTPEYAAPEQVRGEPVTTATDVYALGVLLYVLLGGRHPTALPAAAPLERLRAALESEPPTLSEVAQRTSAGTAAARATTAVRLARDLRGDLDNVVAKALKKPVAERYPTVAALAADLRHYLDHEPVSARPDSVGYRTAKFVRRYRLAVGAASATLLALVAGVAGTSWQAWEAQRQRDAVIAESRYSRINHEVVMTMLDDALKTGDSARWQDLLKRTRERIERQYANEPTSQARLLLLLAGRHATMNDEAGEAAVMQALSAIEPRLDDPVLRAQIGCARADIHLYGRDVAQARPLVAAALAQLARTPNPPLAALADCYQSDAQLAIEEGDFDRAATRAEALVARFEQDGLTSSRLYLYALFILNRVYFDADRDGDLLASEARLEAAVRAHGAADTLQHFWARDRYVAALLRRGQFAQAQARLVDLQQRVFAAADGLPPPLVRSAIGRRAAVLGSPQIALPLLEPVLPELAKVSHRNQLYFATFAVIESYLDDGNLAAASRHMEHLQTLLSAPSAAAARERAEFERLRALLSLHQGSLDEAAQHIAQMQQFADTLPRRARIEVVRAQITLARVLLAAQRVPQAIAALQLAQEVEQRADGRRREPVASAWLGRILQLQAQAHRQGGDPTAAAASLRKAIAEYEQALPAMHHWRTQALQELASLR